MSFPEILGSGMVQGRGENQQLVQVDNLKLRVRDVKAMEWQEALRLAICVGCGRKVICGLPFWVPGSVDWSARER
jgi:hypothetical protein